MTLIFFNQADLASNHELFEIKDKELLEKISTDFLSGCSDVMEPEYPWICGTVIHTGPKDGLPE